MRGRHLTHPDRTAVVAGVPQEELVYMCAPIVVHKLVHTHTHAHSLGKGNLVQADFFVSPSENPAVFDTPHMMDGKETEKKESLDLPSLLAH